MTEIRDMQLEIVKQNQHLIDENRALREENKDLRRRLDAIADSIRYGEFNLERARQMMLADRAAADGD
jgi:regulator of replication initiation timing